MFLEKYSIQQTKLFVLVWSHTHKIKNQVTRKGATYLGAF